MAWLGLIGETPHEASMRLCPTGKVPYKCRKYALPAKNESGSL
jgi:hypothetical protein